MLCYAAADDVAAAAALGRTEELYGYPINRGEEKRGATVIILDFTLIFKAMVRHRKR